jgi:hypothetical protein
MNAVLTILARDSWDVIDEIPLPAREIYDVALATPAQVDELRRGFRTNRRRIHANGAKGSGTTHARAWQLCLTLVQELVAWFDDLNPANEFSCTVEVMELA